MNKKDAKALGYNTGYGIADTQVREVKAGRGPQDCEELLGEVLSTEQEHYRQFSPFEFTAQEFNNSRDPDAVWEAYENGVSAGARARLRKAGCGKDVTGRIQVQGKLPFSGCGCSLGGRRPRKRSRRR